jgi:hypothetical protein
LLLPVFKGINTYLALNGLISCWFCIYLFQKISLFLTSRSTPYSLHIAYGALFLLITGLLAWPMIRGNATNTNYDFITVCCIIILFVETTAASRFHMASEWTIWPCYLFTVRIINGAILLLAIPVLWQCIKNKKWKTMLPFFAMGILLIAPFLIRNILLSGYPLFPALQLDLFSPDWKADKEIAIQTVEFIKYYNRISDYYQPISETKLLSFPDWIPKWFQFLSTYNKFIVVISLMAYVICLFKWKTLRQKTNTFSLLFLLVLGAQLLSWFWLAPDPRFAYGALLCSLFLLFFLFPFSLSPVIKNTTVVKLLIVIVTVACLLYTLQKTTYGSLYHNWILPRNLPVPPFREVKLDHIKLKIPAKLPGNWNPRCYDLPLPCLYEIDPRLHPRGKKIEDGFWLEH